MIIFVPDPPDIGLPGIEFGCSCTFKICQCLSPDKKVMVDIGLSAARGNYFHINKYIQMVKRAVSSSKEVYAVVPDVFGDPETTIKNFYKYSPAIARTGAKTILVLQMFYRKIDTYKDVIKMADVVALPARLHHDTKCSYKYKLCAERIERALRILRDVKPVHLLGPAAKVLAYLGDVKKDVFSIDTASYRMAPTVAHKQEVGGGRMVKNNEMAKRWLLTWLKLAGLYQ